MISYDGAFHQVEEAGLNPLPGRRIPIWFGGGAEAVLRRTGEIGDGWLPQGAPDDEARGKLERVREYAVAAGRDPAAIGFEARISLGQVPEKDWTSYAAAWRELGATHLGVNTMGMGLAKPEDHAAVLRDALPALQT